jgi:hypothetical protein
VVSRFGSFRLHAEETGRGSDVLTFLTVLTIGMVTTLGLIVAREDAVPAPIERRERRVRMRAGR